MNRLRLGFKHHCLLGLYRPQLPQLPRVSRPLGPLSSSSSPGHDEPLCSRRSGPLHPLQDSLYRDPLIVFPPASPAKKRWWWWGEGGGLRSAMTDPVTFTVVLYQLSPSVSCWWSRAFYSHCVNPLLCLIVTHTHTHTLRARSCLKVQDIKIWHHSVVSYHAFMLFPLFYVPTRKCSHALMFKNK